jgi:hypothetical protein
MDMNLTHPSSPDTATLTPAGLPAAAASRLPAVAGTVDSLRNWLDAAKKFETGKLFAQVMAGLELKALWKASGLSQGKRSDLSQVGTSSDRDEICAQVGLSKTQAYRLMEMAEAALPRLKKAPELAGLDILATPISSLTPESSSALEGAVRKLTEGRTQQDFFAEMGLYKKPSKGPGGAREAGPGGPVNEDVSRELAIQQAREDFNLAERTLVTAGANFTLLVDQEVAAQVHVLQMMIEARNKWLRVPKARRDMNAVTVIRQFIDVRHRESLARADRGEAVGELPPEETFDARG